MATSISPSPTVMLCNVEYLLMYVYYILFILYTFMHRKKMYIFVMICCVYSYMIACGWRDFVSSAVFLGKALGTQLSVSSICMHLLVRLSRLGSTRNGILKLHYNVQESLYL